MLSREAPAAPLRSAEFAAALERLARFETAPLVAVAVSGGPDSLALALLAEEWVRRRGGAIRALSVDHRLRPESGIEMAQLAGWLSDRGILHEILVWQGEKPRTGIQEAARAVRYRLLAQCCREHGCLHLLTGHHRDDQIETHLLRRAALSGPDGLAAMPAIRELDGCRILRPLLAVPKVRLMATLAARGQPFISDPSNRNPAFARARLRAAGEAGETGEAGSDAGLLLDEIRARGRRRVAREHARDALLARVATVHPAGFAVIETDMLLSAPPDAAAPALGALIWALGGAVYPPRRRAVARLLRVLAGEASGGHTLGGCRFVAWRGRLLVLRELAFAAPPIRLPSGSAVLWDRRFEAAAAPTASPLSLGYLGAAGVVELRRAAAGRRRSLPLPPLVHPILPAFWDENGLVAVPSLGYRRDGGILLPQLSFRPVNSLSAASFAVV